MHATPNDLTGVLYCFDSTVSMFQPFHQQSFFTGKGVQVWFFEQMGLTTTLDSSFYLKLYNGAHEKNQQYFVTKDITVVIKTIYEVCPKSNETDFITLHMIMLQGNPFVYTPFRHSQKFSSRSKSLPLSLNKWNQFLQTHFVMHVTEIDPFFIFCRY